jgi:DNA-binding transcriptional LysR family regulator
VRQSLQALEAAVMPETFDVSKAQATFRMAMADATAAYWLPSLMRSIESEAPGVNIRMVPLTTREPRPMLVRGDIDLAVGFFPGVAAQLSSDTASPIRHERLYSGRYVCVMRKGHPLAKGELDLEKYLSANHLLVSFSGRAHGLVDEALAQLGRERRILLTVNQFFTAGRVVANSDLITVLPKHLMSSTGMTDSLVWRELPLTLPAVHLDMLWHERDSRNPAHRWLRGNLESTADSAQPKGDRKAA